MSPPYWHTCVLVWSTKDTISGSGVKNSRALVAPFKQRDCSVVRKANGEELIASPKTKENLSQYGLGVCDTQAQHVPTSMLSVCSNANRA